MTPRRRSGLTLVEVIIAMIIFAVGGLALAASSGAMIRQMKSNAERSGAATLAQTRDEKAHASPCAPSTGTDRAPGIVSDWLSTSGSSHLVLTQNVVRSDSRGLHADEFRSGTPCD